MTIVKLKGGIGNQMFQYAFGRRVALVHDGELFLDISGFENDPKRKYDLEVFNIQAQIASPELIAKNKSNLAQFIVGKILRQHFIGFLPRFFTMALDPKSPQKYFDGYWQSEKYFSDIRENLLKDFKPQKPLSESAQNFARKIEEVRQTKRTPISLHVRRGDYVDEAHTNAYHGTCDLKYYEQAIELMKTEMQKNPDMTSPILFIFSDDIEWVKENLKIDLPTFFVSSSSAENSLAPHEEILLMSYCTHNIIANSSFSWWGAWLNQNPYKIVIAPQRWTLKNNSQYRDICPPSWIRI